MTLPTSVLYGQVKWQAISAVADGADGDDLPDAVPVTGDVTFTPSVSVLQSAGGLEPVTVFASTVTYSLGSDGILRDGQGRNTVTLLATNAIGLTPVDWTWTVSYRLNGGRSRGSFSFSLPAGTVIDLTTASPVSASAGTPVIQGPKGDRGDPGPAGPTGATTGGSAPATTSTTGTVTLAGDLGGTSTAPTVTGGTHHTHTSAQVSDATSSSTPNTVVRRDQSGNVTLERVFVNFTGTRDANEAVPRSYVDDTAGTASSTPSALARRDSSGNVSFNQVHLDAPATDPAHTTSKLYVDNIAATKAATSHTHGVTDLTATGTKSTTTYLRGDNTWAVPAGTGGSGTPPVSWGADVTNYGAVGDGTTDCTAAFNAALAASSVVYVPAGTFRITSTVSIPTNKTLRGSGKYSTTVRHAFNGDLFTLNTSTTISDITLDGQGSTYTGRGIVVPAGSGQQTLQRMAATLFDGYALDFVSNDSGSQFRASVCEFSRTNALTTTGRYAVHIDSTQILTAIPRSFVQIETNGTCSFDLGAACDLFIVSSTIGDLKFTPECRGVNIVACRILNQDFLTVDGHGISIVACDIHPEVTIAANADYVTIGPGSYNAYPPVKNLSGNGRNAVHHGEVIYTPTLTAGTTAPSLGNGSITAEYSMSGNVVTGTINLTVGSTTNLGSGDLRFSLPYARFNGDVAIVGTAQIQAAGASSYTGVVQIPGNVNYCRVLRDNSGLVSKTSPATFATGDYIRLSFAYTL